MTIAEFRDLTSAVFDAITSYRGCRAEEKGSELCRVQSWVRQLRECQWPKRLSANDRQRGLRAMDRASEVVSEFFDTTAV